MPIFAVQYLEDGPGVAARDPQEVHARLRAACERLPLSLVLVGWALPPHLVAACREEVDRAGAQLYLWHPLLTGSRDALPCPEWRTIGLSGGPVPGFRGLPEFTFICPQRPGVPEAVRQHLGAVLRSGLYDGVFLDRIRYPSPTEDPARGLACFCPDCRRAAQAEGLDLEAICGEIARLLGRPGSRGLLVRALFDPSYVPPPDPGLDALQAFLDWRSRSITRAVQMAAGLIQAEGLTVGLDCFSPALARLVGQDLGALSRIGAWIKTMSYGHSLGPAGLPFELLALASWLIEQQGAGEQEALDLLASAAGLPLPPSLAELRQRGLPPQALAAEVRRARGVGVRRLFAGSELVEIPGVAQLEDGQIRADLAALREAGADGLVLSWDLWHIPLERLDLVREAWLPGADATPV